MEPLEIQDAEKRRIAHKAMVFLWEAMNLESPPRALLDKDPAFARYGAHFRLHRYVGEMLLGEDAPEFCVNT